MNIQKFPRLRAQRDALHASVKQLSAQRRELIEEIHRFEAQDSEFQVSGFELSAADKQTVVEKREQLDAVTRELDGLQSNWRSSAELVSRCKKHLEAI